MSRLIDADALMADCQLAQKQADRHGREFANAFYSGGGEISTEWWCVEDMIENASTIEERKWIPCSERLPEKEGWYFVTVHPDYIVPDSMHTDSLYWLDGKWWFYDYDARTAVWLDPIIAWMPLPEPYKGGEQDG